MSKVLSICMMVKNEEKNLVRCLESLSALRANISSELIIVDTGSDDHTADIAKQYTDQVYFHPWNNHFSDMRNISISYATGKWILIIDADEELVDSQNLVEFLQKDHPKTVAGGALLVKNLTASDITKDVAVLNSVRIFRNDGFFHYEGAVHNTPIFQGQILEIKAYLNHYGYDSTDAELMERKFVRTSTLLKQELEKDPDNIYYRYQLSVTYMMHQDYEEAVTEIEYAYKLIKKGGKAHAKQYLYVFSQLARAYLQVRKYPEAEKACLAGIAIEKEYLDCYFYAAQAQAIQEKYEQAIENYYKYIKLDENFAQLAIRLNPALNHYTIANSDEALYNVAVMFYKKREYAEAVSYIEKLILKINSNDEIMKKAIPLAVELCFQSNNYVKLKHVLEALIRQENQHAEQAMVYIEKHRMSSEQSKNPELFLALSALKDKYGDLNKIRLAFLHEDNEMGIKETVIFNQKYDFNMLPDYYGDLLYYLTNLGQPEVFLGKLTDANALRFLKYFADVYGESLNQEIIVYSNNIIEDNFEKLRSKKLLLKYVLFANHFSDDEYLSVFRSYVKYGISYIEQIYSSFVLEQELVYDVKSVEEAFLLYMLKAKVCKDDQGNYVDYLKKAVQMFPEMNKGIKLILQESENLSGERTNELAELRKQLLQHIQTLIDAGKGSAAISVIEEYEQLCGADMDALALKSQAMLQLQ